MATAAPHPIQVRADAKARFRQLVRYRLDYHWDEAGRIHATMTVTLPDGHMFRFTENADPYELYNFMMQHTPESFVGFSLGGLWKGIKKAAKSVATSKVFKVASTALAVVAPALGPLAPAALAASGAMKAGTALLAAKAHIDLGNNDAASTLVNAAASIAKSPTVLQASASLANKVAPAVLPQLSKNPFQMVKQVQALVKARQAAPAAPAAAPAAPPIVFDAAKFAANDWNVPGRTAAKPAISKTTLAAVRKPTFKPVAKPAPKPRVLKPATKIAKQNAAAEQQVYALLLRPA